MCTTVHRNIGTLTTSVNWCLRSADTDSKKNYGWRCAELSPCAIAKIRSLTADKWQVSLLALINVPFPSPQPYQHVVGKPPSLVYCVGDQTDGKATERSAVSDFTSVHNWCVDGGCVHTWTQICMNSWDQQTDTVNENSRTLTDANPPFKSTILDRS